MDNFEELKLKAIDSEKEEIQEDGTDQSQGRGSQSKSSQSNKAAVPILDFTQLPSQKKKEDRKEEPGAYDDYDIGSNSIGSIFDHESHLDLSTKRLKKLILTSDFSSLLNLREEALKDRADKEKEKLNNLIKSHKISPRTGEAKALKLEKWITKEKEEIKKTK